MVKTEKTKILLHTFSTVNFLTFLLLLATGCRQELSPSTGDITNYLPQREENPSSILFAKWPQSQLPLELKISEKFSNEEIALIEEMMEEWESAGDNQNHFFAKNLPLIPAERERNQIQDFKDMELGIYKSKNWFSEVNQGALAITQFFGFRKYSGTHYEYVELEHADIFVNYKYYKFRTRDGDSSGTFDFATVILHEIGHFLGLPHASSSNPSVMAPSITMGTHRREPYSLDLENLHATYSSERIQDKEWEDFYQEEDSTTSKERVHGLMELHPDGKCHHYVNGTWVASHQLIQQ